jgi:signal transduction histidine kinase
VSVVTWKGDGSELWAIQQNKVRELPQTAGMLYNNSTGGHGVNPGLPRFAVRIPVQTHFLKRLNAPLPMSERHRTESILANARLLLALTSLFAVYLDPTQPAHYTIFAFTLLFIYLAHSLAVIAILRLRQQFAPSFPLAVQGIDVLFALLITLVTEGPSSPFFAFFFFVLMTAAFRWGFLETLFTAVCSILALLLEVILIAYGPASWGRLLEQQWEVNLIIMRTTYLLIVGLLVGYLAENEKASRAESAVITRLIGSARPENGLRGTLQAILGEILRIFGASQVALILDEADTGRIFRWSAQPGPAGVVELHMAELDTAAREPYMISTPADCFCAVRQANGWDLLGVDSEGHRVRDLPRLEGISERLGEVRSLISVDLSSGEWSVRMLLMNPALSRDRQTELRFAQRLAIRIGPAVYSVYLLRLLRRRAGAIERTRVARELHDGVIQTLISLEMQMDVARRQAERASSPLAGDLNRIQQQLQKEVLSVRELMYQMKPLEVGPHQLLDYLADTVERFRRDTGMDARFESELDEVTLPPRISRELLRVTQEALVNVRRHSGASKVMVFFGSRDNHWQLVVDDDGRGFEFYGRMSQVELDAARKGPIIIKERLRSIGGELSIESSPGRGARLVITVPHKAHAAHG